MGWEGVPCGEADCHDCASWVVGFLLAKDSNGRVQVALVRKNRPAWQAGKLNGIGGKVEKGERLAAAMTREFAEETGVTIQGWEPMLALEWEEGTVYFFRRFTGLDTLEHCRTVTDEPIERHWIDTLGLPGAGAAHVLPNLLWLVPLAAHTHDTYEPFTVSEKATTLRKVGRAG